MACNRKKRNKRGQAGLYIAFMFVAIIIVVLASVLAPLGGEITTQFYEAGEEIWLDTQADLDNIANADVRTTLNNTFNAATDATTTNIDVLGAIFQYGWIITLVLAGLVVYLMTRRLVEVRGGGLV